MINRILLIGFFFLPNWQNQILIDFDSEMLKFNGFNDFEIAVVKNPMVGKENSSKLVAKISRPASIDMMGGIYFDLSQVVDVVGNAEVSFDLYTEEDLSFIDVKLEEADIKSYDVLKRIHMEQAQVKPKWIRVTCRFTELNGYFSRLVIVPGFNLQNGNEMWVDNIEIEF